MNKKVIEKLAHEIKDLIVKHELMSDVRIYFDNKCIQNKGYAGDTEILEGLKASEYFEFANDDLISMSFEGPLNYVFNNYEPNEVFMSEFDGLLASYGLYYELGHTWNLSIFKI